MYEQELDVNTPPPTVQYVAVESIYIGPDTQKQMLKDDRQNAEPTQTKNGELKIKAKSSRKLAANYARVKLKTKQQFFKQKTNQCRP